MNEADMLLAHIDAFTSYTQQQIDALQEAIQRKKRWLAELAEQRAHMLESRPSVGAQLAANIRAAREQQ